MSRPSLRPGLCSVTLRHLPPSAVLTVAAEAGLACVEWGADVHAPAEPLPALEALGRSTRASGLEVASYGTYWRATDDHPTPLLDAAEALGCRRLRIWAGTSGSAEADRDERRRVVAAVRRLADEAAVRGQELAFEHHDGTLADTVGSTLDLLDEVDRPNVGTYWQPRVGERTGTALEGLLALLPHLRGVHVFSWWPGAERLPLVDRADLWTAVVDVLEAAGQDLDLLLEFLPGDDEGRLAGEAAQLRGWLGLPPTGR